MSYLYLPELAADCLPADCLVGEPSALSKSTSIASGSCCKDSETATSTDSRSGTTCKPSTPLSGVVESTSLPPDFLANLTQQHQEALGPRIVCGKAFGESSRNRDRDMSFAKTSVRERLKQQQGTSSDWAMRLKVFPFLRETWVLTTYGDATGYLHTPTTKANYAAATMQKWKSCREFVRVFGKPSPANQEWLMGWPIGWTDLEPLATDKYQQWLSAHGVNLAEGFE